MAFKGKIALFSVKEFWHKKTSKAKKPCVKICRISLIKLAVKSLVLQA
jgi:hypothetical protein